jgi:hypothetical protein
MPFQPGDKRINRAGRRKKGESNETEDIRLLLDEVFRRGSKKLVSDLRKLSPRERVKALVSILPYLTARLQSIEQKNELDLLTPEQVEDLTDKILKKLYND